MVENLPLLRSCVVKTAIYMTDKLTQLVLTPEYEFEKAVIKMLNKDRICKIHTGSFYECGGGWIRQGNDDCSLIVVIDEPNN